MWVCLKPRYHLQAGADRYTRRNGSTSQSPSTSSEFDRYVIRTSTGKQRRRKVKGSEEELEAQQRSCSGGGGLDLESPAEAEPVAPRPGLLPEPAVPPGRGRRRRRGGAAQHLPHHVHVLVLARAHLLPQPPQPCLANPEAGRDAEPDPPHRQHDAVPPVPHRWI